MSQILSNSKELPAKNFISTAYDFEKPLSNTRFAQPVKIAQLKTPLKKFLEEKVVVFNKERVKKIAYSNKSTAEKIIDLFLLDDILTGDGNNIKKSKKFLIKHLNYFIGKKTPIIFTLLQFPFKAPNPLKTERTLPDLGEVAYLYQLHLLAEAIKSIYPYGAKFIILGESLAFKDIADISMGEALNYRKLSQWWIRELGFEKNIELVELRDVEKKIPQFYKALQKEQANLTKQYYRKDKEAMIAVEIALPTILLTLNVRGLSRESLMHIFATSKTKHNLEEKEILDELHRNAEEATLRYLPYHMSVKKTKMRETLWPHSIGLSPIAKPNRFGVFPLNRFNKLYPMHGVAVYTKDGYVVTRYKIDVLRDPAVKYAYTISHSPVKDLEKIEKDPFFYSEVKI